MIVNHYRSALLISAALALSAAACSSEAGGPSAEAPTSQDDPLYGHPSSGSDHYWNANAGETVYLSVCFTANAVAGKGNDGVTLPTPFPGYANVKSWVREWVENSWGRAANIYFSGWDDTCKTSGVSDDEDRNLNPGRIMISFIPSYAGGGRSSTDVNGKDATNSDNMIRLDWSRTTKADYRYIAVHEMGHALGFDHEQQRPDNWVNGVPTVCTLHNTGEGADSGGTYYTSFVDVDSVMCYNSTTGVLSAGDVSGIQQRYGRKVTGSLVGFHGLCANISGASTADGAFVGAWPCTGSWNDTFERPTATIGSLIRTRTNARCLSVSNGSVVANSCSDVTAERFNFGNASSIGAELRAFGDLCITMSGGHPQVATCDGSNAQRWDIMHDTSSQTWNQIRWLGGTNMCLTSATSAGALGEQLSVATCSSTDTKQRFIYPGQGVIQMANGNYCLNVSGGVPTPGSVIGLWNGCSFPPANEQFSVHGHLRNNGLCLAFQNNAAWGDAIVTQTCSSSSNSQLWDFYL